MVTTDRQVLSGLVALKHQFIDQGQLVAALWAWTLDQSRPLVDHLVASGSLSAGDRAAVQALEALHGTACADGSKPHADSENVAPSTGEPSTVWDRHEAAATIDPDVTASAALRTDTNFGFTTDAPIRDGERYTVLRPHARGGLGIVFVAMDNELHREVALKQILEAHADDATSRERFILEAEVTGGLEHPGIVPVYGLGRYAGGRPYYAMRFIKGQSLKNAIDAFHGSASGQAPAGARALGLRQLLRRFTDVCNAIDYAHSRGVLHRDVKPGNIIVGQYGETLVVDWGLAKATGRPDPAARERALVPSGSGGSSETLPGTAIGTPAYMSPEQARGDLERVGPQSDVYALGATLYCLLTGAPPIRADGVADALGRVERGDFAAPRTLDPSIDPALEAICLKAMANRPESRYASCRALADDLDRWMADEPVSAWPEPFGRRARRWARRNRTAVTGAAAALIAGVVGLSAVAIVQARANNELTQANIATTKAKNVAEDALDEVKKAKKATDDAFAQSEESRKRAEAVLKFFKNDVLAATRPEGQMGGLGYDVTVRKALDAAEPKIAPAFRDQPVAEADIRDALGMTYVCLGAPLLAIQQHERAVTLREATLGPDNELTLISRTNLGLAYYYAGRMTDALKLNESTLAQLEAKVGRGHETTMRVRHNLATSYLAVGRTAEAIAAYELTIKLREAALGRDHNDTLGSSNDLALAYLAAGRTADAIKVNEETLARFEATIGHDHPDTIANRNSLGQAYYMAGRAADAVPIFETTLKQLEVKLGADHPNTLSGRNNLAAAYLSAGRASDAVTIFKQTLTLREAKLGPDHPFTLQSRNNLAAAYELAGQPVEALRLKEETVRLRESKLGLDHPDTLTTRSNLAALYETLGRWSVAEAVRRESLNRRRKTEGPESSLLTVELLGLGRNLMYHERYSEAEPLFRDLLILRAKVTPDSWLRYEAMSLLGGALSGQGLYAQAEPLLIQGYDGMKSRESKIPPDGKSRLGGAAVRVINLYEHWGKPEQASAWKRNLRLLDLPANPFAALRRH